MQGLHTLLTSIAYHAQTDGQSERTNQTVEIAVRFLLATNLDLDIVASLPVIQFQLNNSANASTGLSPNEIVYGFKIRDSIYSLSESQSEEKDLSTTRLQYRQDVSDAISYANA